jgi:hypothetical protein
MPRFSADDREIPRGLAAGLSIRGARWSRPAREALKAGAKTPAVGPPTVKRPFLASADPEV